MARDRITIRMEPELRERAEAAARAEGRKLSNFARRALEAALEEGASSTSVGQRNPSARKYQEGDVAGSSPASPPSPREQSPALAELRARNMVVPASSLAKRNVKPIQKGEG